MIPVKEIMTTEIVTVTEETPIYEALNLLSEHEISGMPVLDADRQLVGMLTEKDVLSILINPKLSVDATVGQYMSRKVVSFLEDDDVIKVCKFFISVPLRRVPIVKNGKLVGIVSRHDIVKLILKLRHELSDYRFS